MSEQNLSPTKAGESRGIGAEPTAEPEGHPLRAVIECDPTLPQRRRRPRAALLAMLVLDETRIPPLSLRGAAGAAAISSS